MGLLGCLMGNASEVNAKEVEKESAPILTDGETIEQAYELIRDFTNKHLILLDKQGVTGKKKGYYSIPYKSITHFRVETAGNFDLDAEQKIRIPGTAAPIEKKFKSDKSTYDIQKELSDYVLK